MDLRQLRYFAAIVEQGSFSKAATKLRVAQPALSQHLRHMEDELGVALLHRGTRGVLPTEAGERLLARAHVILAEFGALREAVRGEAELPGGEVRIGLPGTVSEQFSVPLIQAARERYPAIRIRIAEAMSGFVLDWLRRGEVDLAMIYSTSDPKGLGIHHVLTEELCLFCAAGPAVAPAPLGQAVTMADAAALDLILPGIGHGLRDQIDEAAVSAGATIQPAIEI
ncbi:MAG: LysR substrate-binding domain-containing protein, partial [Bosea sp. (in: a-proteobacteria)]|nr:LysR substrate-binding domain-containing protein [Bosea sp. (in: a-proteobacteria)]